MIRLKLFPKTFLITTLLFISLIAVIHGFIFFLLPQIYEKQKKDEITQKANMLIEEIDNKSKEEILEESNLFSKEKGVNISITIRGKEYYFESFNMVQISTNGSDSDIETFIIGGQQVDSSYFIMQVRRFTDSEGNPATLQMMTDVKPIKEARSATLKSVPYTLTISLISALIFSYFYSKYITKPIKKMVSVTGEMEDMSRDAFYPIAGSDEINILGARINALYTSLLSTIDALEEENIHISNMEKERVLFMRAASHELKTPLTNLRVVLENMLLKIGPYKDHDRYLEESIAVVDKLYGMIQNILISHEEVQGGMYKGKEYVEIDGLVKKIVSDNDALAEAKGINIVLELDRVNVHANGSLCEKVLSNLISNAIRYTEKDGTIVIRASEESLSIRNECEPIGEDKLQKIFDPLYRLEDSRNSDQGGSGMGLYIVKMLLESEGFKYSFLPYEKGMEFIICLKR
ncbi:MAG: HAMP domain-containing histidine kinase [Clostridiales bacterium]|nr:HAMP domain-containing histidine kinase [Clostridiales bacterium]MBS5877549.1 HAMP domain-containing histidine kinase [Clostridiales bacterium]MDU1042100.1 HAMP domain-containing sensor histidine kinase [Clostridiales bacterium]MDU3489851.1 HAMP domain-containing sensor histidine kinase [Clostridiales bacterium]